jgi:hypothetical protein
VIASTPPTFAQLARFYERFYGRPLGTFVAIYEGTPIFKTDVRSCPDRGTGALNRAQPIDQAE